LNLKEPEQIIPAEGVYAGWVSIDESPDKLYTGRGSRQAVFSIGQARTFGDEYPLLIEAHLLGEKTDEAIGKWMAMDFAEHIRTQHKFRSEKELARQISEDCGQAETILKQFETNFARK
jgi:riboflavin kinase/FMN adenylyltransferase